MDFLPCRFSSSTEYHPASVQTKQFRGYSVRHGHLSRRRPPLVSSVVRIVSLIHFRNRRGGRQDGDHSNESLFCHRRGGGNRSRTSRLRATQGAQVRIADYAL